MPVLKFALTAAILTSPVLLASASADAATARQATSQGQGLYTTSQGVPVNFIGGGASQQAGASGAPGTQVKDFEHHGRYFGGN